MECVRGKTSLNNDFYRSSCYSVGIFYSCSLKGCEAYDQTSSSIPAPFVCRNYSFMRKAICRETYDCARLLEVDEHKEQYLKSLSTCVDATSSTWEGFQVVFFRAVPGQLLVKVSDESRRRPRLYRLGGLVSLLCRRISTAQPQFRAYRLA